jgi:hypothetical protein
LPLLGFQSFLFELKFKFRYPELESCLVLSLILQAVIVGGGGTLEMYSKTQDWRD